MILNIGRATAEMLLVIVDTEAEAALRAAKLTRGETREEWIKVITHLGLLKHRLEHGLGYEDPFIGPAAWGYPISRYPIR